ncbi:helix-turn-helix domain-containing protein [Nodosilinea nodulosa]|uniref:helix-turn-helix domain-containing protein n=1 Tax=Nodosilinea nodulosa TaxID=416001 RepID=UPI000301392A|nr:helix-turn-helix transcriptional regulator [Nodosilinea nodulosa]
MGKAGRVLKQVLETYGISQNKLAVTMGIERTVVYRWTHDRTDPVGDTITSITSALNQLNPKAAQEFVDLYLGEIVQNDSELLE